MLQKLGFSSNLPLIVITIIVVALTILCYIESKRVASQFDQMREKINDLTKKFNQINKLPLQNKDELPVIGQTKENKVILTQEKVDKKQPNENVTVTKKEMKHGKVPSIPAHPLIAMMMGGSPPGMMMGGPPPRMMMGDPPPGMMMPDELTQKIEEWDDNMDEPINISKEEEIIENILEEHKDIGEDDDIQSDNDESDEEDSDEEGSDEEDDEESVEEKQKIDPDTKMISLVDTSFSVKQLQDICKEKKLNISGNKTQLINRINSH